jgi:hypothetical protein
MGDLFEHLLSGCCRSLEKQTFVADQLIGGKAPEADLNVQ